MENKINVAKTTAIAGTVGVGVGAAANAIWQKSILNKPDEFITQLKGQIVSQKKFNTPFFKGTKEASDMANKKLDEVFKKIEEYVKAGKINFKAVAKNAAVIGAIGATIAGAFALIYNNCKKEIRNDAQIVADEFKKAKVGE